MDAGLEALSARTCRATVRRRSQPIGNPLGGGRLSPTLDEIAALTNCAKADERLLEDITTIRTDVLRELRHVAELFLALTSES